MFLYGLCPREARDFNGVRFSVCIYARITLQVLARNRLITWTTLAWDVGRWQLSVISIYARILNMYSNIIAVYYV